MTVQWLPGSKPTPLLCSSIDIKWEVLVVLVDLGYQPDQDDPLVRHFPRQEHQRVECEI